MQYVCLIYFDPKKVFNQSPEANAVLGASGPHDAELKVSGHLLMSQALTLPTEAVTVVTGRCRRPTVRSWRPKRCWAASS